MFLLVPMKISLILCPLHTANFADALPFFYPLALDGPCLRHRIARDYARDAAYKLAEGSHLCGKLVRRHEIQRNTLHVFIQRGDSLVKITALHGGDGRTLTKTRGRDI